MKREFIEKYIYEKFKDYCFVNAEEFKKMVAKYDVNASKVWAYISKYQVKKYGTTIVSRYCKAGKYKPKKRRKKWLKN